MTLMMLKGSLRMEILKVATKMKRILERRMRREKKEMKRRMVGATVEFILLDYNGVIHLLRLFILINI